MEIRPIAYIHTDFPDKFGIPRQSGRVSALCGDVIMLPEFSCPQAFRGIDQFSHLWLLFDFSLSHRETWSSTVRPPRLGGNVRMGVFASRSPFRPNPIGLSCVQFDGIEQTATGIVLHVSGIDLHDGTPIIDIKPYLPLADCRAEAVGGYADTSWSHRLKVVFPEELLECIPVTKRAAVMGCLADDPRPSYQNDPERVYNMRFSDYDIHFTVQAETVFVIGIDKKGEY